MATARSAKPPETAMDANSRDSAMVEQAPYNPRAGSPVFRREKLELIHWFSRSPEKTRSTSFCFFPAFCSKVSSAISCMWHSAFSQVFSPK